MLPGTSQSFIHPSASLVPTGKEGPGQDGCYSGCLLRVFGVGCFYHLMAMFLALLLATVSVDGFVWVPLGSQLISPFCPVPCWVDFLSLAACLCLAKARGKYSQCHSPPSSLVNFRTSKGMLCLSLLFSIPDTYINVLNAHFLCFGMVLGKLSNGDLGLSCFLVHIA